MQVDELVQQQGDLQVFGELGTQHRALLNDVVDLVEPGVEPRGAGTDRDGLAGPAGPEQGDQLLGSGDLQLVVELLGPPRVGLVVGECGAVRQGPPGGVLELQPSAIFPSGSWAAVIDMA
ncbi:hypothetical protein [Streptomyces celluloflavus]|uniref:hypothetical protein n=1 Tax=Streptomyces celluloflavus TaxID=58344 RepID=UPI0036BFD680